MNKRSTEENESIASGRMTATAAYSARIQVFLFTNIAFF